MYMNSIRGIHDTMYVWIINLFLNVNKIFLDENVFPFIFLFFSVIIIINDIILCL